MSCRSFLAGQFSSRCAILATDASPLPYASATNGELWCQLSGHSCLPAKLEACCSPPCRQPPHEVVASTSSRLRQQLARSRLPPHGNQFAPLKQEYKLQAFPAGQFSPHCAILATGAPPLPYSSQHTENSGTSCQDMAAYKASGKPVIPPQTSSSSPARHISSMWRPAVPADRTQPRSSRQHWKLVCALPQGPFHAPCPHKAGCDASGATCFARPRSCSSPTKTHNLSCPSS